MSYFPQAIFSPRNVVGNIRQALDILQNEVCSHFHLPALYCQKHFVQTSQRSTSLYVSNCKAINKIPHIFYDLLYFSSIQVPRAIVNLVELLNIVPLRDLHEDDTLNCPSWFVKLVMIGCKRKVILGQCLFLFPRC